MAMRDKRAWAPVDIGYLDNPKMLDILDASSNATLMHLASILYCAQHLTDGHVSPGVARRKVGATAEDVRVLVEFGLWHEPGHDCEDCPQPEAGKVYVHDFLEHNRTAEEAKRVSSKRSKAAQKRWADEKGANAGSNAPRMQSALHDAQQPAMQNEGVCNAERDRERETSTTDVVEGAPSRSASTTARGQRLPEAWKPDSSVIAAMAAEAPHVDQQREHAKFTDYWQSQPGAKGRKSDWNATYRNWIRRAAENAPKTGNRSTDRAIAGWQAMSRPKPAFNPMWDQRQELPELEEGA